MPHMRNRYLTTNLLNVLKFSPLVGLLGHRQVGKTTLLETHCNQYLTFDDIDFLISAKKNIKSFLQKHNALKTGIDECQVLPSLFPALKEVVRKDKRPGQYILSGSVRFTSRKAIRESLTGRILNLELLPFTISEIHHRPLPESLHTLIQLKNIQNFPDQINLELKDKSNLRKDIESYLHSGGLPGVCFIRKEQTRQARISEQLATILDRDIRMVYPTTLPYSQILDFVKALAQEEGQIIKYSQLAKEIGITEVTQKKLLYALEAVFLIRLIPSNFGRKGHILYFEDQAEALYLSQSLLPTDRQFESFCYRHVRAPFFYTLGDSFRFFHYQTRNGAKVPFAVETGKGTLGFIPIMTSTPSRSQIASANSFLKTFDNSKIVFLSHADNCEVLGSRSLILPVTAVI